VVVVPVFAVDVAVAACVTASPPVMSSIPDTLAAPTARRARRAGWRLGRRPRGGWGPGVEAIGG
jgi:hypothetical protein